MPKCIFLVGVPAAGKSTYVDATFFFNDRDPEYFSIQSTDAIITDIAAEYGYTYDQAFNDLIKFADRVFWDGIIHCAEHGISMVIDRTNLSVKSRKRIIDMIKTHDYELEAVVFPTPEASEWQRRLDSRPGKTIPKHILESMAKSFSVPTETEGFNKITIIDA